MRRPRNTTEQLTGTSCVMKHGKSLLWLWIDGEDYSSSSSEITSISPRTAPSPQGRSVEWSLQTILMEPALPKG